MIKAAPMPRSQELQTVRRRLRLPPGPAEQELIAYMDELRQIQAMQPAKRR